MEVKLDKRYPVPTPLAQAWAVLRDVRATAACMPGARITEQVDDRRFKGTVTSKVGPATMQFAGEIEVLGLDIERRTVRLRGKGADKSGSSASLDLTARLEPAAGEGECTLVGLASVVVGGKLVQFGSRLLVPVSDALLSQFAENFAAAARAQPAAADERARSLAGRNADSTLTLMIQAGQAPGSVTPATAAPVKELNVLGLVWTVVKGWWASLLGRR
jgi:carbon monoxide dehydrogenase subunit G